jgi:hypothetical protein
LREKKELKLNLLKLNRLIKVEEELRKEQLEMHKDSKPNKN